MGNGGVLSKGACPKLSIARGHEKWIRDQKYEWLFKAFNGAETNKELALFMLLPQTEWVLREHLRYPMHEHNITQ